MFDGDWEDLINVFKNLGSFLLKCLNTLAKTIIIWFVALLPAIIFITLACLNITTYWFFGYSAIALATEIIWVIILIESDSRY